MLTPPPRRIPPLGPGKRPAKQRALAALRTVIPALLVLVAVGFGCSRSPQARFNHECATNLSMIDGARGSAALEKGYPCGYIIPDSEWTTYLKAGRAPVCPSGGQYTIPGVGGDPVCSVHGNPFKEGGIANKWPRRVLP
jgi:hypothetical protein